VAYETLMSGAMIALFVAMIPVSIWFSRRSKAKTLAAGRALGEALGLRLVGGEEAFQAALRDSGRGESMASLDKLPPFVRRLLVGSASWSLRGERGGVRVAIYPETRSSGRNSTTYTVVRAFFNQPLGFELSVTREGAVFKLGKSLLGIQDVELGDPELDSLLRIKAGDPTAVRLALGRGDARKALTALAASGLSFQVRRDCVHWDKLGTKFDSAEIAPVLDLIVPAAAAIRG